jgi:DNA-binding Lrp family transcriptional regulator
MSSQKTLAKELGIPASTLTYRIERMKREGLIVTARYWMNVAKVGGHRFAHLVAVRVPSAKLKAAFFQFARESKGVFVIRSFLGRWDFLLETHHEKGEEVAEFTSLLHARFPVEIAERETLSVLTHTKVSDCTARATT